VAVRPRKKGVGDGGSAAQKRAHGALSDAVRATKKSSTPVASGTTTEKGVADQDKAPRIGIWLFMTGTEQD
jgi:hypothetical protein